jgi:polar amino acid transport system substrate-binding protein
MFFAQGGRSLRKCGFRTPDNAKMQFLHSSLILMKGGCMKKICFLAGILVLVLWNLAFSEQVKVIMDYYPPFSYEENGEIKGIGSEVVRAVLKEAGIETPIKQYPFARAYQMTQKNKNIFEYCVIRTPEREKLFQWVGVVSPATHAILALKDTDIRVEKLEDLSQYTVGTVLEDVVDQYLRKHEQRLGLKLDRVADYELNINKLFAKRFELCGTNKLSAMYLSQKLGHAANDIKSVYTIEELNGEYYLVTGLDTPPETVKKLRAAFETVHSSGLYQKIVDGYFSK